MRGNIKIQGKTQSKNDWARLNDTIRYDISEAAPSVLLSQVTRIKPESVRKVSL